MGFVEGFDKRCGIVTSRIAKFLGWEFTNTSGCSRGSQTARLAATAGKTKAWRCTTPWSAWSTTTAGQFRQWGSDGFEIFDLRSFLDDQSDCKVVAHARDNSFSIPSVLLSDT